MKKKVRMFFLSNDPHHSNFSQIYVDIRWRVTSTVVVPIFLRQVAVNLTNLNCDNGGCSLVDTIVSMQHMLTNWAALV